MGHLVRLSLQAGESFFFEWNLIVVCDSKGSKDAGGHPAGRVGAGWCYWARSKVEGGGERHLGGGEEHGLYLAVVLNHPLLSLNL